MIVEIAEVPAGGNEFGVGVNVRTEMDTRPPDNEGATFVGISMAINEYMRARGSPTFNCLKPVTKG